MIRFDNFNYVYLFILFIFSISISYFSILLGRKLNIIDNPSLEKIHSNPIPRSGGVGIFLTFLLGILFFHTSLNIYESIFLILIFLLGFIDDLRSVPQRIKFITEIGLAILLGVITSWRFSGIFLLDILFFVFYLVGSINAMNEIDGMDGLAGGVALISSLFLTHWFKDMPIIVAIACLGFLVWNFHPAKIFMGDGGSLFLGAFIGITSLKILSSNPSLSTLIALIFIYSVPVYDSFLTVIRRLYSRTSIFKPDLGHFYNKLYDITGNYIGTVMIIYIFAIVLGLTGLYLYEISPVLAILIGGSIWGILTYLGYRLGFITT